MRILRAPAARRVPRLVAALPLASALLLASCSDAVGIFASLSQEKPIGTLATKDISKVSPSRVVRYDYGGNQYFFMSAGSLYERPLRLSAGAWKPVDSSKLPAGASRCVQIAAADRLYANWLDANFNSLGLYASSDAVNWTAIAPAGSTVSLSSDATAIRTINGLYSLYNPVTHVTTVFVATTETTIANNVSYKLYYLNGDDAAACAFDLGLDYSATNPYDVTPIRSMTVDGAGNYWFVSGQYLYTGSMGSFTRLSGETGMPTGATLSSVSWSADLGRLIVTTGSGVFSVSGTMTGSTPGLIFARRASDGVWEASAASVLVSASSGGYANFTDAATVKDKSGSPVIVAASASSLKYGDGKTQNDKAADPRGYGVLVPASDSSIGGRAVSSTASVVSTWSNYETSLMNYAVNYLFYLPGNDKDGNAAMILFAGTSGKGLWSNARRDSDGVWEGWEKE